MAVVIVLVLSRSPSVRAEVDFAHDVVPILRLRCAECHAGDSKKGGFSLNDRASILEGGESGKAVEVGNGRGSYLIELLTSEDPDIQMPPQGQRLGKEEVAILTRWIDEGLAWETGFAFKKQAYEPPLELRRPELPPAVDGREHPVDRIVDHYLATNQIKRPAEIEDRTFLRRSSLDLIGLPPKPDAVNGFLDEGDPDKRRKWLASLLADDIGYADHWLTFWNDLLRNDYSGTGFITGGRKQISRWLYESLVENKPFNQMASELIAPPSEESRGFIEGIKWRGDVSAGQTVEIQFSQSLSQSFLGINMKCASCHDSFIDRWKLKEAYGLAAVYASKPLEIHRCDKPIGETAEAAWLFPELGDIDPKAPPATRLKQLAELVTSPRNGRFARTIVNRLWHRLMGRGLVHPVDSMQSAPWSEDLLDHLASKFVDDGYDLRKMLLYIASSKAYQSAAETLEELPDEANYRFAGLRAKRLTAEQFMDAVWSVSGQAPKAYDAPVFRGKVEADMLANSQPTGQWIWGKKDETPDKAEASKHLLFQKSFKLDAAPKIAGLVITANREYSLFVNNRLVDKDADFRTFEMYPIHQYLRAGNNSISILAEGPTNNPAAGMLFAEATVKLVDETELRIATDDTWQFVVSPPAANEKRLRAIDRKKLKPITVVEVAAGQKNMIKNQVPLLLARATSSDGRMIRASLMKNSFLMRSLGRPARDQIVSTRPNELTTLEAMDLSNGQPLADLLVEAGKRYVREFADSPEQLVTALYEEILVRKPSSEEVRLAVSVIGSKPSPESIEDLGWAILMSPEFQFIR